MTVEWGLPTQFAASDAFLNKWADAQKLQYGKDAGWIVSLPCLYFIAEVLIPYVKFWNFKIEISDLAGDTARQWCVPMYLDCSRADGRV